MKAAILKGYHKKPESFKGIFERMTARADAAAKARYHKDWQKLYNMMTIIDTGINDCRNDAYKSAVQKILWSVLDPPVT